MKKKVKKMRGINLIGQRFGRLQVIELVPKDQRPEKTAKRGNHWICQCDCGNKVIHYTGELQQGDINSCGCLSYETKKKKATNEIGNKYGKLTVLQQDNTKSNGVYWICECECGNIVSVLGARLRNGHTKSCGCIREKNTLSPNQKIGKYTLLTLGSKSKGHKRWVCQCECGSIRLVDESDLKQGRSRSCGCVRSWGEQNIAKILQQHQINYIKEYSFKDLKMTYPLRFDFAIFNNNHELVGLIEYQGEQHYNTNNPYYNENIVKSDKMKQEYCQNNSINLYEIKYNENLDEKMKQIISQIKENGACDKDKGAF